MYSASRRLLRYSFETFSNGTRVNWARTSSPRADRLGERAPTPNDDKYLSNTAQSLPRHAFALFTGEGKACLKDSCVRVILARGVGSLHRTIVQPRPCRPSPLGGRCQGAETVC